MANPGFADREGVRYFVAVFKTGVAESGIRIQANKILAIGALADRNDTQLFIVTPVRGAVIVTGAGRLVGIDQQVRVACSTR